MALTPQLTAFETNPEFLQAGSPSEFAALLFPFTVTVVTGSRLLPDSALCGAGAVQAKLGNPAAELRPPQGNTDWAAHFRRELQFVDPQISGRFISRPVSIAEVLKLGPGSIVPLRTPTEVTVYIGEPGVLDGRTRRAKRQQVYQDQEIIRNERDSVRFSRGCP